MDSVGGHGEDSFRREGVRSYDDGWTGRNDTREAKGGGGVDAESFGDNLLEAILSGC